ncbi:divalent-cation tolerance protein CutA [Methylacidiphilum caldifontis]|uniref:Cation tolerance protein CutA n=1 Tax=Methylacidiphilum caldifontis TaxID=2795386 RepID=A0A4Y8PBS1_9BACT|nr:divalent-cation tolerance protein CutA [Methylacidiphilum caldifontis]TFE68599.1 cation tolerance protein CutA [Methylacidiphilum caldifontis]
MEPQIILISCASIEEGQKIAKRLLDERLASCVNVIPQIYSYYWWENKQEEAPEILLIVKTSKEKWDKLVMTVKANHSYQCPEIISFEPSQVFHPYLSWWQNELK